MREHKQKRRFCAAHIPRGAAYRRFANVCFQSIWNRQHVKAVQVIFKEDFGTDGRGGYFDKYGIIRDVMQNHLLQVLALVAMEQPLSFGAEHIRTEKLKVLQAIKVLTLDDLVTGQYTRCGNHKGYLEDPSIENTESTTETFAAAVLHIHNPRWDGVSFILKAGKAVTDRKAEVRIQFHTVPGAVSALTDVAANELVVRLQPEETIYWKVINKVPALKFEVSPGTHLDPVPFLSVPCLPLAGQTPSSHCDCRYSSQNTAHKKSSYLGFPDAFTSNLIVPFDPGTADANGFTVRFQVRRGNATSARGI